MSKVICEICGTSYPETSNQCPICGCVKPADVSAATNKNKTGDDTYTYVKGGRFSKKNVKKRTTGMALSASQALEKNDDSEKETKTNRILVITMISLFLAVVAVVAYIVLGMFGNTPAPEVIETTVNTEPSETTEAVTQAPEIEISVSPEMITLETEGQEYELDVTFTPEDTTEIVRYSSDAPEVVTVDKTGKLTAVSEGEATITVTCGTAQAVCTVVCEFPEETTAAVTVTEFKLNKSDFTLAYKGESWRLYNGDIPVTEITWTSDNEAVATVKDGKVVAVGAGVTKVHAEYDGQKYSCIVRCTFKDSSNTNTNTNTNTNNNANKKLTISNTDVTLSVGEAFYLTLKDENGKNVDVSWSSSNSGSVQISGNKITGKAATSYSKISATYGGIEYSCIVRVTN